MAELELAYFFGEGPVDNKDVLGGKGSGLGRMTLAGLSVPPGWTITTANCIHFMEHKEWPAGLQELNEKYLAKTEEMLKLKFADESRPLLFSVRSGAKISMPGMMDTVLNLGLNDKTVVGLAKLTGNERFAVDSYRRFIQMFGDVVMNVHSGKFEHLLTEIKAKYSQEFDTGLTAENLKELIVNYRAMVKAETGSEFPQDPREQLRMSINAVFESWSNPRAVVYRRLNNIPDDMGTAVNVQSMVYGNMGETSGTGVGFTRNPSTGVNEVYGEFLTNAQGEDVVAGIRTPIPVKDMMKQPAPWPKMYEELIATYKKLEEMYVDMVDLEFTVQEGKFFMLQARVGKRTATAMVRIAVEMHDAGVITEEEAILRVDPVKINELLHPQLDPKAKKEVLAKGLPASPGAAVGTVVFHADDAEAAAANGPVILVRTETCPEDLAGMHAAEGILTARGGMTSHAAVVARGMGKCCVAGCSAISVDEKSKKLTIGDLVIKEGDWMTLDGALGEVIKGKTAVVEASLEGEFGTLMKWADKHKQLMVRTNADSPHDVEVAINFGAEGIGLCRTEHMFFEGERIKAVREMIIAKTTEARRIALAKLLPFQRSDFEGIFKALAGRPCNIRLLDPPLHEFLPHEEPQQRDLAKETGKTYEEIKALVEGMAESNPMLGFRGCRLGMIYPEISQMQVQAIMEAAIAVKQQGVEVHPEIMIPVLASEKEMSVMRELAITKATEIQKAHGVEIPYKVGTMIELPRACIIADKIAQHADFFSFGTNDLTQTAFGYSRDDAGLFIGPYVDRGVLVRDPFQVVDFEGVGELMKMAVDRGRKTKPGLKVGICGEQGGEQDSVDFCHRIGLNYVSCSPYRVPIARVAAAQAAIRNPRK